MHQAKKKLKKLKAERNRGLRKKKLENL